VTPVATVTSAETVSTLFLLQYSRAVKITENPITSAIKIANKI